MKRTVTFLIVVCMLVLSLSSAFAVSVNDKVDNSQTVVNLLVDSINKGDWKTYVDLQANINREGIQGFINDADNAKNGLGIFNVKSAKIKEMKALSDDVVAQLTNLSQYKQQYNEVQAYLVGIDYRVKKENKYFFNGVNYILVVLGKEADNWKVIEMSDAPLEILIPAGYGFGSEDEKEALKIIKARINGDIVNKEGKLIESNKASYRGIQIEKGINSADIQEAPMGVLSTGDHVRPDYIRVYHDRSSSDPNYHKTISTDFYYYVKNVLPNEWYSTWPSESLKAGAMAVKMYGWYHVYHPKWPSLNADVKDTTADQVFIDNTEVSSTTTAINNVGGVELENSSGAVFETQYLAGTQGQPGTQSSGKMSQWGTKYWADQGTKTYIQMCHYYYDNSDKSSGAIATFSY
ncbi:SpoIID/LytB domain-containing protein [Thermoanaerobacterium thermosaccharolyticum]|uniref:SpoIID/LytB domain-containing protein n=1 Tax=Thermoanaerobacterium thermosaccharolyticum TaxID=1517 RepID=UPI003DAA4BEF